MPSHPCSDPMSWSPTRVVLDDHCPAKREPLLGLRFVGRVSHFTFRPEHTSSISLLPLKAKPLLCGSPLATPQTSQTQHNTCQHKLRAARVKIFGPFQTEETGKSVRAFEVDPKRNTYKCLDDVQPKTFNLSLVYHHVLTICSVCRQRRFRCYQ